MLLGLKSMLNVQREQCSLDTIFESMNPEKFQRRSPNAQLIELQCGHGITDEMPEELTQALVRFLV